MQELIEKIAICVERGKVNKKSPYPPDMRDQDGADELTVLALNQEIKPSEILDSCMDGMERISKQYSENIVFVPELLMAAEAMNAVMNHLKPYFQSGEVKRKGQFIIGTVTGDLHDIGKNMVVMCIEGAGWDVLDLGVDVDADKFLTAIAERPNAAVGLSALLTTTMENMDKIVQKIRAQHPNIQILIGGAPVSQDFREKIGADFYSPDPQGAVQYLNSLKASS